MGPYYISDLICSECGTIFSIPRRIYRSKRKYHIKNMNCNNCKKETKFIELINADVVKKELEFSLQLNDFERNLYELLTKENIKNERQKILK